MEIGNWQAEVRVSLDGTPLFKAWASRTGGDLTTNNAKTRTGGMGRQRDVGGQATRNDLTLTIQWSDDVLAKFKFIESRVGNGEIKVGDQWLGRDRRPRPNGLFGRTGILKGCSQPDYDTDGNVVGVLTMVVGMDELGT